MRNQRTIGPVSLTWVLRMCWIRTNFEIHDYMLYKLSPIQKHQETNLNCHKNGQGQPRVIISKKKKKKKSPGLGHTTTWYKFWQHFKAFISPIILYQFQKDPFCLIILYDILFYFIHVYIGSGQEKTTLEDNVLMEAEKSSHFGYWLHLKKNSTALWFYAHFFYDFIHVHSPRAGADNPLGPIFSCPLEGLITLVICWKFRINLLNQSDAIHIFSWFNKCI